MNHAEHLQRFASIALAGLNLQPGQPLAIKLEPENLPLAEEVARQAYRAGSRYVELWPESSRIARVRLDESPEEYLEFVPASRTQRNEEFIREKWALLSVKSPVDLSIMDGVDAARAGRVARGFRTADANLHKALSSDRTQWTVMAVPTEGWAGQVLGMPAGQAALDRMWEVLTPILRMDHDDPPAAWREHGATLKERCARLQELGLRSLHFTAEGTDLTVPLHASHSWLGGGAETGDGIPFLPNIPTEEVFTAPFAPGVSGRVQVTRPVRVYGTRVEGAWFEFAEGRVARSGAQSGAEALQAFMELDEGSRMMGEIALVDGASPITTSGVVFQNILLDENAACHFALGSAYPTCLTGGSKLSEAELEARGANRSNQHLDFMIGSADMAITGVDEHGRSHEIMRAGRLLL